MGGLITWITSDEQGCINFELNQNGPGVPPVSTLALSPTTIAGPSTCTPFSGPTAAVIESNCNSANSDPNLIVLTTDVQGTIQTFCNNANNLQTSVGPSVDITVGNPPTQVNCTQFCLSFSYSALQFSWSERILLLSPRSLVSNNKLT
jgi:hypothetical protein